MTKKLTKAIAGPWRQDPAYVSAEQGVSRGWNIHDGNGQFVCTISNCHENGQEQTDLIAAATELLDVCKEIAGLFDCRDNFYADLKAAINKAEGRTR